MTSDMTCEKRKTQKVTSMKLATSALTFALLSLPAGGAWAEGDILERYRAQGGMIPTEGEIAAPSAGPARAAVDPLATGHELSDARVDGFNSAIEQAFPMTPEMIRRYQEIMRENERAAQERPEPREETSTTLVSLEPGEPAPLLKVSPSIASVIGFYDATGAAWPITQYVLGDSTSFDAQHLGEDSSNIVLTPRSRIGFTNLVVVLEGHDKPVTVRVNISEETADYRYDVQVMQLGPNASANNAAAPLTQSVAEAGDGMLLAVLSGVDLPDAAKQVRVVGADVRGWMIDGELYLRSRHALLSPSWTASMAGPDGVRVYRINPASVALFSVGGQIVRTDIQLP